MLTDPVQQACMGATRKVGGPGWRRPGHTLGTTGMRDEFWAEVALTHTGRCELRSFPLQRLCSHMWEGV